MMFWEPEGKNNVMNKKPEDLASESEDILSQRRKRLFLWMCAVASLVFSGLGAVLIYLLIQHQDPMRQVLLFLLEIGVILFVVLAGLSLLSVVYMLVFNKHLGKLGDMVNRFLIQCLLPAATVVAGIFGVESDAVRGSFVEVNNEMVDTEGTQASEEILVLLPRCLQWAECPHKVSQDVTQCDRCGNCSIDDILTLCQPFDVDIYVSTGGTQARRIVEETRPNAIVAVACERELTEGIRDVRGVPVFGVINLQPNGPCFNTSVDVNSIVTAIKQLSSTERGANDVHV